MISLIPYIGGKHRIARKIAPFLHATGADCLVDVFGGSAAVLLNSGFEKRVYNDADEDLVNLMRVIADDDLRPELLRLIRMNPPARKIFEDLGEKYMANGFFSGGYRIRSSGPLRFFTGINLRMGGKRDPEGSA